MESPGYLLSRCCSTCVKYAVKCDVWILARVGGLDKGIVVSQGDIV